MKIPAAVDYIVVGQGLAGSAVALQLLKLGKKILVIDDPSKNRSSRIAAGLFNPVTGKNLVKTWMADQLFPYLHQFYREAEQLTAKRFFFPMRLYRPFTSVEEQNEWMGRSADPAYRQYIEMVHLHSPFQNQVKDPHGGMVLKQCGYLLTSAFLDAVRQHLEQLGSFWEHFFDAQQLLVNASDVTYRDCRAGSIIFCQGGQALSNNAWFKGMPIQHLKGETLTIKSSWNRDVILNRGVYMVPGSVKDEWRVGSTYDFNDISAGITAKARQELEGKLNDLISFPYTVISQDWGWRPTTTDRRPILGKHPEYEHLIIFNGLGTKGVSLAPYFSDVLIRSVADMGVVNKDVDVTRYKLLY